MRDPPLCTVKQLRDGTYNINDIADMHEAMDAEELYAERVKAAKDAK